MTKLLMPATVLYVGAKVNANIWSDDGVLLLRRGQTIASMAMLESIMQRKPVIKAGESPTEKRSSTANTGAVRLGIAKKVTEKKQSFPETIHSKNAISTWAGLNQLHKSAITELCSHEANTTPLKELAEFLRKLMAHSQDLGILVVLQQLIMQKGSYSSGNALMVAMICDMVWPLVQKTDSETQDALQMAALTMNIGMHDLQDILSYQQQPPSNQQREKIQQHPNESVRLLTIAGIEDPTWLRLVQDHHENQDGSGYPNNKNKIDILQQLLNMVDVFVARLSPRRTRSGLVPHAAVKAVYLSQAEKNSSLGVSLVRALGIYPPGTYVRLHNGEVAVVLKRGKTANTPLVMPILNVGGFRVVEPVVRDTSSSEAYKIESSVYLSDLKAVKTGGIVVDDVLTKIEPIVAQVYQIENEAPAAVTRPNLSM